MPSFLRPLLRNSRSGSICLRYILCRANQSGQPVVHKEALVRLLRALGGDMNVEDTARILKEMNVKEEDKITIYELFDQYTRRGLQKGLEALISTCRELGISFDETAARVKEKFSLEEEETRESMQLYW